MLSKIYLCWISTYTIKNSKRLLVKRDKKRTTVRNVIDHCRICRKNHGSTFKMPKVSPWPEQKVSEFVLFSFMGVDYLDPS